MANNNTISSFTEDIIETLKTIQSLEILQAIEAGMRLERIKRTMVSTQKGYLSIGGKSLLDIVGECSKADVDSLFKHITEKRPRLALVIEQLEPTGSRLWETCRLGNGFDVDAFNSKAQEALAADQSEAVLDDCIWASMEWKWQTRQGLDILSPADNQSFMKVNDGGSYSVEADKTSHGKVNLSVKEVGPDFLL